jgi:alkylmercury lyase
LQSVPVAIYDLVAGSASGADNGQETLDVLVQRGMAELDGDKVIGIGGLSLRRTQHRMNLDGKALFTWCAADAVGIPAALGEDTDVITTCPHCSIAIVLRAGEPAPKADVVLSLPTSSCSHVVTQFCPEVNFFCNGSHLEAWRADRAEEPGQRLTIDEVAELGREWWGYLTSTEPR